MDVSINIHFKLFFLGEFQDDSMHDTLFEVITCHNLTPWYFKRIEAACPKSVDLMDDPKSKIASQPTNAPQ